jgi:protein required for attachment to host cells
VDGIRLCRKGAKSDIAGAGMASDIAPPVRLDDYSRTPVASRWPERSAGGRRMNIHHKALVLVADGQNYLLLRNEGNLTKPVLKVEARGEHASAPTSEQGSDRAGRAFATSGARRSAMEQSDLHKLEMDGFARQVAEMLQAHAEQDSFEELIVVAPPHTLSELRKHRGDAVAKRLVAEVTKNLTNHTIDQIAEILMKHENTAPA